MNKENREYLINFLEESIKNEDERFYEHISKLCEINKELKNSIILDMDNKEIFKKINSKIIQIILESEDLKQIGG